MNIRDNLLCAVRFENPEYIPIGFHINPACWHHYPQDALQELMESHQLLFPGFKTTSEPVVPELEFWARAGYPHKDAWGCIWKTTDDGIVGSVVSHPLSDWKQFEGFKPPNPEITDGVDSIDWSKIENDLKIAENHGALVEGTLHHGHTFLRLCDLRGYEKFIFDMMDGNPRLTELIMMVEKFNLAIVNHYIELGVEWMSYPEDLGMQIGPMLSPELFRKYIKPSYQRLITPARKAGCVIHMHSDGDIRSLVDDIIDGGVDVINLQDIVNGINWIQDNLAGKVCIDLDIDRQSITVAGTTVQIDAHIREIVEKLGSKRGGLMLIYGLYPGVPLENAKAVMDAMEKYSTHYSN